MKYACHREQFNKGYILIFSKEPPSCHLLEMALYSRSTTSAKAMFVVVVVTIFSWYFMNVFVFFFTTYLWFARQDFSHASSAHCHQENSDLKVMFLKNMDLESKQKFSLGYYNWMLILIPFNPRRLVFLVFLVQIVAFPLQKPRGRGGGGKPTNIWA